ncbi:hypothetical protein BELL_0273g00030 [Botrytis elliptica]|uniref:Protein kinase domain-containing protein n=1 Tax=Botrytis elliptica TaxID=278938 RepID=A0A4Z1JTK0_9HELO|nr:hypothetical protein EAE99_000042 [Botrytis elliptica]TGO74542.1 hypothetical protein BELL_0273g00030 [Botrytis elliptica]
MDHPFSLPSNSKPYYHNNGTVDFEDLLISDEDLQMWGDLGCSELANSSNSFVGSSPPGWAPQGIAGSEEYQELSAPSSYNSHPPFSRDLNPNMGLPSLLTSFPPPPTSTPVAKDGNYDFLAWINTVQNNGSPISTGNNLSAMYPISMSREWNNRYNASAYQRTAENAEQHNNTASWQSQILNSTDSSPHQRGAPNIASRSDVISTQWQPQSYDCEASSFIEYKPKPPSHSTSHKSSPKPTTTEYPPQSQCSSVSDATSQAESHWTPPNHPLETITPFINPTPFASTLTNNFHFFHSHSLLYKSGVTPHELQMHLAAGSCGVTIHGTVSIPENTNCYQNGTIGLIIAQEMPLTPRLYLPTQRKKISESMRQVVSELHEKGIVHGDIHLSNFLLCASRNSNDQVSVKLSNFHDSLFISTSSSQTSIDHEKEEQWTPVLNGRIVSPNRANEWMKGRDRKATKEDDLYALGICMWELWSGKRYDETCGIWEDVRRGDLKRRGVDMKGVGDKGVRAWVRAWLRGGGAIV